MYGKKRGLVVVVFLSIFLFSGLVSGEETTSCPDGYPEGARCYEAIHVTDEDCDSVDEDECQTMSPIDFYCPKSTDQCSREVKDLETGQGTNCDSVVFPKPNGCIFYATEWDPWPDPNSCAAFGVPAGLNIDSIAASALARIQTLGNFEGEILEGSQFTSSGVQLLIHLATGNPVLFITSIIDAAINIFGNQPQDAIFIFQYLKIGPNPSEKGVLCANDKYWLECNQNVKDKLYWINTIFGTDINQPMFAYKCEKKTASKFEWVLLEDFDKDLDGFPQSQDCRDLAPGSSEEPEVCSELIDWTEESNYQLKTQDELKEFVRGKCGNKPKYSACSACINPGAPEICGDQIDNDCNAKFNLDTGEVLSLEKNNNLDGETPDSCDANQDSCEQRSVIKIDSELEGKDVTVQANNNLKQIFSWVKQSDGQGFCCGYNGIADAGKIIEKGKVDGVEGNYLCVTKEKEVVGFESPAAANGETAASAEQLPVGWPAESSNRCGGKWCLLEAGSAAKFNVFTVKKPELSEENEPKINFKVYDVVSNGQNWYECNEQLLSSRPASSLTSPTERGADESLNSLKERANRFACFKEGSHYSWAECGSGLGEKDPINIGIKGRRPGEGIFTLPLEDGGKVVETFGPAQVVDIDSQRFASFKNYYGEDYLFDFTGYNKLNFLVKFEEENVKPLTQVTVTILGPGNVIYFKKNVLGDITNSPFYKDREGKNAFMHVEADLPELKAVRSILIESSKKILVRNVYLSNMNNNFLCSGQSSPQEWSWITDIDQGDTTKNINAENLCAALYGKETWLGNNDEVDVRTASCCGNIKSEYYAGKSKPFGEVANPDYYACWNSLPLKSGDTVMDVEFKVGYGEENYEVVFPEEDLNVHLEVSCSNKISASQNSQRRDLDLLGRPLGTVLNCGEGELINAKITNLNVNSDVRFWNTDQTYPTELSLVQNRNINTIPMAQTRNQNVITHFIVEGTCRWDKAVKTYTGKLSLKNPVLFQKENVANSVCSGEGYSVDSVFIRDFSPNAENIKVQFLTKTGDILESNPIEINSLTDFSGGFLKFSLNLDKVSLQSTPQTAVKTPQTFSYACQPKNGECLFPLPGNPPYTITNEHPGLYDLYFVTGNRPEDETLITKPNQQFAVAGNLKAKQVSQQVLFAREKIDGADSFKFFGCSAAEYLKGNNKIKTNNNLQHCSVKMGAYCAYSHTAETGTTTVNTWSKNPLKVYEGVDPVAGEEAGLQVIAKDFAPAELTNISLAVPGKNILTNAKFNEFAGNDIPGWDVLEKSGTVLTSIRNKQSFILQNKDEATKKITIPGTHVLKSNRISVEKNTNLRFSMTADHCRAKLLVVDQNGQTRENAVNNGDDINTGDGAYVQLEITDCVFSKAMLQIIDELGPAEYSFSNPQTAPRSAAACCPQNYCWNGYHCVEPMTDYTTISEEVEEGRNYRCVAGKWVYQQIKKDWKNNLNGFCNANEQCLVRPSTEGGEARFQAPDFYAGNIPTCINNGEYILDNYCDKGNWSSRTKFLAQEMLARVGNDKNHRLYCANFNDVFTNLNDNQKGLLQGVDLSTAPQGIGEEPRKVCFPAIKSSAAAELVSDEENTCINNACVLLFNDKTALATTLNKLLDDPNSFVVSLGRQSPTCAGSGKFKDCQGGLFFHEGWNAAWFSKDGLDPEPGAVNAIIEFFQSLFSRQGDLTTEDFFSKVKNFREIYSAKEGRRRVLALQEQTSKQDKIIIAEYENFDTPVCEYLKEQRIAQPGLDLELLESASGLKLISCITDGDIQRVEAVKAAEFLWPELTAKLRIGLE